MNIEASVIVTPIVVKSSVTLRPSLVIEQNFTIASPLVVVQEITIESKSSDAAGHGVAALGLSAQARGYALRTGSGTAPLGLSIDAVGSKRSSGSGSAAIGLSAEAEGEAPGVDAAEGGGIAALGLITEAVGRKPSGGSASMAMTLSTVAVGLKPSGGSGTSPMTMTAEAIGSKPSGGDGPAAMLLTAEADGEAPATGSTPPTIVGTATTGTPAAATSFSITKPTSAAEGEQLWAHIQLTADRTITLPSGWNFAYQNINSGAGRAAVIWKLLGAGEPSSYTINLSGSAAAAWGCVRVSGANSTPVNVSSNNTTINSWTSPAVTTTVDNCLVLRCHAISRSRAIIAPSGTTSIFNVNNGSGASVGMAHETLATAGTTGTRAFTYSSGTADRPVNGTVAIAPA
jgi:hypothetical protein